MRETPGNAMGAHRREQPVLEGVLGLERWAVMLGKTGVNPGGASLRTWAGLALTAGAGVVQIRSGRGGNGSLGREKRLSQRRKGAKEGPEWWVVLLGNTGVNSRCWSCAASFGVLSVVREGLPRLGEPGVPVLCESPQVSLLRERR